MASRRRSHRRESGHRCPGPLWGHRGARPRVGVRSRGQRPTSRRGGYRGGNLKDPDTTAAVTHGPGPKFRHEPAGFSERGVERQRTAVPLDRRTRRARRRTRGVARRAPLTMGSVSEGGGATSEPARATRADRRIPARWQRRAESRSWDRQIGETSGLAAVAQRGEAAPKLVDPLE